MARALLVCAAIAGPLFVIVFLVLGAAGLFVADPFNGYPPGTPLIPVDRTVPGGLHDMVSSLFFVGLPAAGVVLGRRFRAWGQPVWARLLDRDRGRVRRVLRAHRPRPATGRQPSSNRRPAPTPHDRDRPRLDLTPRGPPHAEAPVTVTGPGSVAEPCGRILLDPSAARRFPWWIRPPTTFPLPRPGPGSSRNRSRPDARLIEGEYPLPSMVPRRGSTLCSGARHPSDHTAMTSRGPAWVEDAEHRLSRGDYGRCTECGRRIPAERLQVLPTATTCTGCSPTRRR